MSREVVPSTFAALRVDVRDGVVVRSVGQVELATLPDGDVCVRVEYSSLNYKDALSASGNRGVTRNYPHTPGIDAAGSVVSSRDPAWAPGDQVLCTGFDLGMDTPGGFGEYIKVPGEWLVALPDGVDARWAMAVGTAGLTAAIGLERLEAAGVTPDTGPLVVTGASGGVGSLGVAVLARAGFEVVASTGKDSARELLMGLGANRVIPRSVLSEQTPEESKRPLLRAEYAGGLDTVGGSTLDKLIRQTAVGGAVAACGLVAGAGLNLTVHPFILRGVALMGISSQHLPARRRPALWNRMASELLPPRVVATPGLVTEVGLSELEACIESILAGGVTGRVLVRHGA